MEERDFPGRFLHKEVREIGKEISGQTGRAFREKLSFQDKSKVESVQGLKC